MVPDSDDPATPYYAADPAGAPVIQANVDPVIPDSVAPARSGDDHPLAPGADAPKCVADAVMHSADAPMTSHACARRIPGDVVP